MTSRTEDKLEGMAGGKAANARTGACAGAEALLRETVRDIQLGCHNTLNDLLVQFRRAGGFTAKNLAVALDIYEAMVRDELCTIFLAFPACILATGTRGVVCELVKRKLVDVIITTSGSLDHDFLRTIAAYYHG